MSTGSLQLSSEAGALYNYPLRVIEALICSVQATYIIDKNQ